MPFEAATFLLLVLIGGAVAIDGTSFGQFMISRPLVSATLAGALVGNPVAGATIGLILEAFHLTVLPVGAAKYPEGGPAAVSGGAVYASIAPSPATLLITVLLVLLLEWLGGESVRLARQSNSKLVPVRSGPVDADTLEIRHLAAIACDFGRGMVLVALGVTLLGIAVRFLVPLWGLGERIPQTLLTAALAGLLASSFRMVGARIWFTAAGALLGAALLLLGR